MARLAKHKVHAALDKAAANILSAAGDDPFVSRKDIRQKLMELEGVEQQLTSVFYRFMDHRDYKPGARITKKHIVVGLDGSHPDSEYPVYFVGLSAAGAILSFKTRTVWT